MDLRYIELEEVYADEIDPHEVDELSEDAQSSDSEPLTDEYDILGHDDTYYPVAIRSIMQEILGDDQIQVELKIRFRMLVFMADKFKFDGSNLTQFCKDVVNASSEYVSVGARNPVLAYCIR